MIYLFFYRGCGKPNGNTEGDCVFELFDDFNGDSVDLNKWNYQIPYSIEVSDGKVTLGAYDSANHGWVYSKNQYGVNTSVRLISTCVKRPRQRMGYYNNIGGMSDWTNLLGVISDGSSNFQLYTGYPGNYSVNVYNPGEKAIWDLSRISTTLATFGRNKQVIHNSVACAGYYGGNVPSMYVGFWQKPEVTSYGMSYMTGWYILVRKYSPSEVGPSLKYRKRINKYWYMRKGKRRNLPLQTT